MQKHIKVMANSKKAVAAAKTVKPEDLIEGQSSLVRIVATSTKKVQLEIAEVINRRTKDSGPNLLLLLNKSDERFSTKARRAWKTAEIDDVVEQLGHLSPKITKSALTKMPDTVEMSNGNTKKCLELNILNPTIEGYQLRVQINETTEPDEYQASDVERNAKKTRKGEFILSAEGEYIFSDSDVVLTAEGEDVKHEWVKTEQDAVKEAEESQKESSTPTL